MRRVIIASVILVLGAAVAGCSRQAPPADRSAGPAAGDPVEAGCRLTMGWDPWPPFHYQQAGGELAGFDVELVRAMAAEAGCELRFERDSWSELLVKLREGSVDLLTGATLTEARQQFAAFSAPIRREEFALYVRAGEIARWNADAPQALMAQGFRVGVTDAYVYDPSIEAVLNEPEYAGQVVYAHFGEALGGLLIDNEIDGFVENVFAAASFMRRLGLTDAIARHPMQLGEGTDVHIMYSRASVPPPLVRQLDEALAKLKASGGYEALRVQYLE